MIFDAESAVRYTNRGRSPAKSCPNPTARNPRARLGAPLAAVDLAVRQTGGEVKSAERCAAESRLSAALRFAALPRRARDRPPPINARRRRPLKKSPAAAPRPRPRRTAPCPSSEKTTALYAGVSRTKEYQIRRPRRLYCALGVYGGSGP